MPGTATKTTAPAPFSFQPPSGGDVTLRSREGTIFNAHSVLLGLASTVFAGMFAEASTADTIELAEDAESISLMLAFIYPIAPPQLTTVDQLEKVMVFSQKYDIAKMIDYLERDIRPESELIHSDPIRLFRASTKYGFPSIKLLSIQAVRGKHCDISTPSGFVDLAQRLPEASSVIGMIGAQVLRARIVPEIMRLVKFSMGPRCIQSCEPLSSDDYRSYMSCRKCWNKYIERRAKRPSRDTAYDPGWLLNWAGLVRDELIDEPMHKCEYLFSVSCLRDNSRRAFGGSGCADCIAHTLSKPGMFEDWTQGIKQYIERELRVLDVLYTL